MRTEKSKWRARVYYRRTHGLEVIVYEIVELADLHDLVEAGPHWDTIWKIDVRRINHLDGERLTVEQALEL